MIIQLLIPRISHEYCKLPLQKKERKAKLQKKMPKNLEDMTKVKFREKLTISVR